MRTFAVLSVATSLLSSTPAIAGPAEDATKAITTVLDKFNGGDVAAFQAAHRDGAIIIDEVPPYSWAGAGSVKRWLDAYGADAAKRGVTGGRVDYGAPTSAYIVLPTTYSFLQNGKKMAGKGSMTFVMAKTGADWKIASWTYSGATATPQ